ncbi:MAG: hypothetical protein J6Q87_01235 [Clostridia bacterium]|nr:hypothetical protein [Clostridia bacterium]
MKTDFRKTLKQWYNGELNLDNKISQGKEPSIPTETTKQTKKIETIPSIEKKELQLSTKLYNGLCIVFCLVLSFFLIGVVNFLPLFAKSNTPTDNEVSHHYVAQGRDETGAINTVAGMILDYRAFDTLGESFVLFTATCAVLLLLEQSEKNEKKTAEKKENFLYKHDTIVCTVVKFIIPIIFVFGVYILFNGHLSPGGGFSGGAILGAALILFAMAFGEEQAAKVFTPKIIRIVTIASLSFYCLAKSYSFFTGNEFNELHSIISAGTPGNFLSGGLILPLNIAVGCVVCCTMYSFYMLFKRGRLD